MISSRIWASSRIALATVPLLLLVLAVDGRHLDARPAGNGDWGCLEQTLRFTRTKHKPPLWPPETWLAEEAAPNRSVDRVLAGTKTTPVRSTASEAVGKAAAPDRGRPKGRKATELRLKEVAPVRDSGVTELLDGSEARNETGPQ